MNKIIIILFLAVTSVLASVQSYAMDYPHNDSNTVSCEKCHYVWGSEPSLMIEGLLYGNNIDDTHYNSLCWSCHNSVKATDVETHSSLQIDNGYGDWSIECVECHDAHGNYQFRTYGSSSYIAQDIVETVNATTLTRSATTPLWADNSFVGKVLVPNIAYDYNNYVIISNDNTSITVDGTIDTLKVTELVDTFAVVYSNMVKTTIITPNSGNKAVKLFNAAGPNSFADADASYDGICEVCHTQTTHHRNDASGDHIHNAGQNCTDCHSHLKGFNVACDTCHGNPPVVDTATGGPDGLVNAAGVTGSSTAGAHDMHVNTKSYSCTVCHYDSVGTGATHNNGHTVTMGFYLFDGDEQGGLYEGQSGVSYDTTTTAPVTTVASNDNKTCSNIYCHSTGQSTVSGGDDTPTYASPVWDDPASGDCGSCHKVEEGAGLSSGSHEAHLNTTGVAGCAECHTGAENNASAYNSSNHINRSIDVANSYDAGGLPGNGYGKCSTGRCHDDGLGNAKNTPDWGIPGGGCSECHLDIPSTGSHVKHVTTTNYNTAECGDCHDGAVYDTTAPEQHLDGDLDVYDSSAGDLNYPQDVAKGGAPYDSCSTAYCHSPGQASDGGPSDPAYATVTWGGSVSCGDCHKVEEGDGLTSGSHGEHLGTTGVDGCGDCHTGAADNASAYNSTNHVDGSIDVANTYSAAGAPGNGYGTCSTASCHDNGRNTPVVSPAWGSTGSGCGICHAIAPSTGSHTAHLAESGVACNDCHDNAVQNTTIPTQHLDDNVDVYDSSSGDLGYPQNKARGSAYSTCDQASCHSNGLGTYKTTPTWGTTASGCNFCHNALPTTGAHSAHVSTAATAYGSTSVSTTGGTYDFDCGNCHPAAADESTYHRNGAVDIVLNKNDGGALKSLNNVSNDTSGYTQSAGTSVTCSAAYCHSKGDGTFSVTSPDWYGTFAGDTCGHCHTNQPDTNAHEAHVVGIHYDEIYDDDGVGLMAVDATAGSAHGNSDTATTISCNTCHIATVNLVQNDQNSVCGTCHDGGTAGLKGNAAIMAGSDSHLNGLKDVAFDAITMRTRAQLRDNIASVPDVNAYWNRNGVYKSGDSDHDSSRVTLDTAEYNGGSCASVACHSGNTVLWNNGALTCAQCHTDTPQ